MGKATFAQLAIDIIGSIRILSKHQYLIAFVRLVKQSFQFIQFLVCLSIPFATKKNHLNNLFAVLLQVLFESSLEVCRFYPGNIILLGQQFIIPTGFLHIDFHVCRYIYQVVARLAILVFMIVAKDVVDVFVLNPFLWQIVLIAYRQRKLVLNGIDKNGVTQYVAIKRQEERETTRVDTFKEGTFAEPHHALTCATEILQQMLVCR